jgi:hypothetical protein
VAVTERGFVDGSTMEERTPAVLAELHGLKLRQLQARADQLGVDEQALDAADDRSQSIALIVAKLEERAAGEEAAALKEELGSMKLRALQRKAEELCLPSTGIVTADRVRAEPKNLGTA